MRFNIAVRAAAGNHVGDFDQTTTLEATDPDDVDPRIRHALRIRARKLVLREIQRDRFDFEGADKIDLEIYSHKKWKLFLKSLSTQDKNTLMIW